MRAFTKSILLLIPSILLSTGVWSQSFTMRSANKKFETMRYASAIPLYEKELAKHKNNREAKLKLAESYRKIKDTRNAERLYAELAHEQTPEPQNLWYYAGMLAQNGKHNEAANWYEEYSKLVPEDQKGRLFARAYKNIQSFYGDSATFKVRIVPSLNSWQSDFSPVFYKRGLLLCSNRNQQAIIRTVYDYDQSAFVHLYTATDTASLQTEMFNEAQPVVYTALAKEHSHDDHNIYTSNDTDIPGHYGKTFLFDSIQYHFTPLTIVKSFHHSESENFHEGPATAFKGQDTLIYTKSIKYGESKIERLALYMGSLENGEWVNEQRLPINNESYSIGHPALTHNNKRLYFTSDMPGGIGGTDIYYADYDNGAWGAPVNVSGINTTGDEMFPYADENGNLYFSSNGIPGLGGLDIFYAEMIDGKIASIKNPGFPMNSFKDDFGIIINTKTSKGFLSSNRKRGFSDDDIYYFERLCETVNVLVYDSLTKIPLPNTSVVINGEEFISDDQGKTTICLPHAERTFVVSKTDYEKNSFSSIEKTIDVALTPLRFVVEGVVKSEEDKTPMMGVRVTLLNLDNNSVTEVTTDNTGAYSFPLSVSSSYRITAAKNNCGTNTQDLTTKNLITSKTFDRDINMLCKGDIIKVENIYYDLNKADIRTDAATELDKLAEIMWKYPDMRIELRSHTDSRSSSSSNFKLSTRRAEAAVDYLTGKGIVPSRMRAAGYGESLPINKCKDGVKCTEEEYQQNRRTEFKVLSIK